MKYIFIISLSLWSSIAFACSCDKVGINENFKFANVVFKGELVNRTEISTKETITGSTEEVDYPRVEFKFKIINSYKGINEEEFITIVTTAGGTDCGNNFSIGEKYIVYAYNVDYKLDLDLEDQKTKEFLTTSLCTRTKKAKLASLPESVILKLL